MVYCANMSAEVIYQRGQFNESLAPEESLRPRIPVLVAGLPGKMASQVSEALSSDDRFQLITSAITSERHAAERETYVAGKRVFLATQVPFQSLIYHPGAIALDFTTPGSVNTNAQRYVNAKIPFVMGTSGGDRERLEDTVRESKISAVVAPNIDPQVLDSQMGIDEIVQRKVRGSLMAIEFLDRQMRSGSRGQVFSMADVLRGQSS